MTDPPGRARSSVDSAPQNKWSKWSRPLSLAVTALALSIIFYRIDSGAFFNALGRVEPGWFLLATAVYGLAFLFGGWRWHLTLRLTECAVHPSASGRLYLIGHYFFIILFGGLAGDVARSTAYARWYGFPVAQVFAAAPLDRLLGLAGMICFATLTVIFAGVNGGLNRIPQIESRWPWHWLALAAVLLVLVIAVLFWWRPGRSHFWERLRDWILSGARSLAKSPAVMTKGLICGFVVQVSLAAVLALTLEAVSPEALPWEQMIWTIPVILTLSALPITVAGLGLREGAAIVLLGLYGVPAENAVAASLLSLAVALFWAAVGGVSYWREERRFEALSASPPKTSATISAVIPVLNEAGTLEETVRKARELPEIQEIIVVDGGSEDGTRERAAGLGCKVLSAPAGRGGQMRAGARAADGDVILLLHADTWLPPEAGRALLNCLRDRRVVAGGFWKEFRQGSPLLLLGSKWKCAVRFYIGRRIAGDQAIFVRRDILEAIGGVPDMALMEEFELCRRLRKMGRLALADATVVTSARRFAKHGVVRTYLRMWKVATLYRLGKSPVELRRLYEQK